MRAFDPRVSAAAVGLSNKELANLLTRLRVLAPGTPGVRRRVSWDALRLIDLTATLARHGVSATAGVRQARALLAGGRVVLAPGVAWTLDTAAHAHDLETRLAEAAERVVARRRGRPRRRPQMPDGAPPCEDAPSGIGAAGSA